MPSSRIDDLWISKKTKERTPRYGSGLRWQAVIIDDAGHKTKKSFRTQDEARAHIAENAGKTTGKGKNRMFNEYAAIWRARQVHQRAGSLSNIDTRLRLSIIPSMEGHTMKGTTRADVQDAVTYWIGQGLSPSTIGTTYTYLAGIFAEAVLDDIIPASPCVKIKLPADERAKVVPLESSQVQQIVERIWRPYRHAVVFAAATGMRPGEWAGLTLDRVDLAGGWVTVDRQFAGQSETLPMFGPPKTAASYRRIKIGPATVALLEDLEPGPEGLLFHSEGRAMTRKNLGEAWRAARKHLPWMGAGWHQLRHHHASLLIAGGASPVAVAHRLGHKDATETLRTYAHLWPDDDAKLAVMSDGLVNLPPGAESTGSPRVAQIPELARLA